MSSLPLPSYYWDAPNSEVEIERFKRHIDLVISLNKDLITETDKLNFMLYILGTKGIEFYNSTPKTTDDKQTLTTFWTALRESKITKINPLIHCLNLTYMNQEPEESINQFVSRIKSHVEKCKYTTIDDPLLDQLVRGTHIIEARELILDQETTTLADAIKILHKFENITLGRSIRRLHMNVYIYTK